MSVELISTPNPHLIPGYTGFCPQYKYRIGDTYGSQTHKLLLDPTVSHAEKLVLSDRTIDDYQISRPPQRDIDIVNARFKRGDAIYKHPSVPGYEGFVPRLNGLFGQRYSVQATEALSEFEQLQNKDKAALNQLVRQGALQDGKWNPKNLEDREIVKSEFKLPLLAVRPECAGVLRNLPVDEPPLTPPDHSASPYFMDNTDPEKYLKDAEPLNNGHQKKGNNIGRYIKVAVIVRFFVLQIKYITGKNEGDLCLIKHKHGRMSPAICCRGMFGTEIAFISINKDTPYIVWPILAGFTGHVPFGYASFGKTNQAMTNSALCDFTSNYRKRLSTEWAPVSISRPDPPLLIQPSEIYHKHIGQLPNYAGHIPGAIFRFGKTYGNDSRDAKRWLRGDFST